MRLRLNVTQEVPLSPFICNRSCHIEDNVDLGWERVKEGSFVNNAKLFFKFSNFCLILKVFTLLSVIIKKKFSK